MGYDKVDFIRVNYIVSSDTSWLMHLQGCARRLGIDVQFVRIAQILNGTAQ
jgi:L-lactate dehydrogenase complex protein LldE